MKTLRYTGYILLVLTLGLLHCKDQTEKTAGNSSVVPPNAGDSVKLHKLKKLFVTGDFDGDGREDTVFQHAYSGVTRTEIDYSPDPFQNEWDTVVNWFYHRDTDVYLTIHKDDQDTLHLGPAQGLYCLLNIGDINADRKDEVAFVIDRLDFSRLNSCAIYSLCNNRWTMLKQFEVHEGAFDFTSDKAPDFDRIKDYLEKKNGQWVYSDYLQSLNDSTNKMLTLRLDKCK